MLMKKEGVKENVDEGGGSKKNVQEGGWSKRKH